MKALTQQGTMTVQDQQTLICEGGERTQLPAPESHEAWPRLGTAFVPEPVFPMPAGKSGPEPGTGPRAAASSKAPGREPAPRDPKRSAAGGDATFTLYLREIGQLKPLTPRQETRLAARVKKGDKQARAQMIKASLRRVVKIARDYDNIGLPLLDLVSEGNVGLMKAVAQFDPAKGGTFSDHSSWWIRQSIKRALANHSRTLRLVR